MTESFNLPVAPHFMMELSIHALYAVPNGLILEDLCGGLPTNLGILVEPTHPKNGALRAPDRPGHGIVLNAEALTTHVVTGPLRGRTPTRVFALK